MAVFDLRFAEKLADVAIDVAKEGLSDPNAKRAVLYLSLLSTELSLKAMLERAGRPVNKIRERSHDLSGLLRDLSRCKVESEIAPGHRAPVPASKLRALELDYPRARPTVGRVLDAEKEGASKYPNQIRYGAIPRHFPPGLVAQMASEIAAFARQHWNTIHT